MWVTQTQSRDSHVSNPSSIGRKIGHDPNSTTSGIEVYGIGNSSKHAALSMGDKANRACIAVHLERLYDAVNVKINR